MGRKSKNSTELKDGLYSVKKTSKMKALRGEFTTLPSAPTMECTDPKLRIAEARRKYRNVSRPIRSALTQKNINSSNLTKNLEECTQVIIDKGNPQSKVEPAKIVDNKKDGSTDEFESDPRALKDILNNEGIKLSACIDTQRNSLSRWYILHHNVFRSVALLVLHQRLSLFGLHNGRRRSFLLASTRGSLLSHQLVASLSGKQLNPDSVDFSSSTTVPGSILKKASIRSVTQKGDLLSSGSKLTQPSSANKSKVRFTLNSPKMDETRRCLKFGTNDEFSIKEQSRSGISVQNVQNENSRILTSPPSLGQKFGLKPTDNDVRVFCESLTPTTLDRLCHFAQITQNDRQNAIPATKSPPITSLVLDASLKSTVNERLSIIPESPQDSISPYISTLKKQQQNVPRNVETPKMGNSRKRRSAFTIVNGEEMMEKGMDSEPEVGISERENPILNDEFDASDGNETLVAMNKGNCTTRNDTNELKSSSFFQLPARKTDTCFKSCSSSPTDTSALLMIRTPKPIRASHLPPALYTSPSPQFDHSIEKCLKPPMKTPIFLRSLATQQSQGKPPFRVDNSSPKNAEIDTSKEYSSVLFGGANSTVLDEKKAGILPPLNLSPIIVVDKEMEKGGRKKGRNRRQSLVAEVMLNQEVMLINEQGTRKGKEGQRPREPVSTNLDWGDSTLFLPIANNANIPQFAFK